ncbi:MAG: hypothetical protein KGJ86_10345 [Chloroflexota bacterium]|nr:hypothetical protein [Chloroflexota bacterium]
MTDWAALAAAVAREGAERLKQRALAHDRLASLPEEPEAPLRVAALAASPEERRAASHKLLAELFGCLSRPGALDLLARLAGEPAASAADAPAIDHLARLGLVLVDLDDGSLRLTDFGRAAGELVFGLETAVAEEVSEQLATSAVGTS